MPSPSPAPADPATPVPILTDPATQTVTPGAPPPARRVIGELIRGRVLRLISRGRRALFGGMEIALDPERTTTVTGTLDDVNVVAARGWDPALRVTVMGANPGGINILRSPRWAEIQERHRALLDAGDRRGYWAAVTRDFWAEVNEPWMRAAIARGDQFRFVSDPANPTKIFVTEDGAFVLDAADQRIPSIFGREVELLRAAGYVFEGAIARRPSSTPPSVPPAAPPP